MPIKIKKGATYPDLTGVASIPGALDLSGGASVTLTMYDYQGAKKIDGAACVVDAVDNVAKTVTWSYEVTAADTDVPGVYSVEIGVTADGEQMGIKPSDPDTGLLYDQVKVIE